MSIVFRLQTLQTAAILAAVLITHTGCKAMSDKAVEMKWEWPAGRPVASKLLLQVDALEKASSGWFGFGRSPSLADNLPDAHTLQASVVAGPPAWQGRQVTISLPGPEAKKLTVGTRAGLALTSPLDAKHPVVICVAAAPTAGQSAEQWLENWTCEGP